MITATIVTTAITADNRDTRADNAEGPKAERANRVKKAVATVAKPSQNVEARDVRQTSGDDAEKAKSRDEQQPRGHPPPQ